MSYTRVTAPISGRVDRVLVTEGNLVSGGTSGSATQLTTIVSVDPLYAYFDIDEAMNAAAAVGDDRIQEQATGRVTPDNFTHGTSEQRQRWFRKGFMRGDLEEWDTFNINSLFNQN